jgi:hypothetical protein
MTEWEDLYRVAGCGDCTVQFWSQVKDLSSYSSENECRLAKDSHQECGTTISLMSTPLGKSLPLLCSPLFQLPQDNLISRLILLGITSRSRLVPTLQINLNILIVVIDDRMFWPNRSPCLSLLVGGGNGRSPPSAPTGQGSG